MKKRADLLLVEKNIVETRSKAQAMIMAGQILFDGKKVIKSGELYNTNVDIVYNRLHPEWVSRGALKLLHALNYFKINVTNFIITCDHVNTRNCPCSLRSPFCVAIFIRCRGFNVYINFLAFNICE